LPFLMVELLNIEKYLNEIQQNIFCYYKIAFNIYFPNSFKK
jgi:hypothetical protein